MAANGCLRGRNLNPFPADKSHHRMKFAAVFQNVDTQRVITLLEVVYLDRIFTILGSLERSQEEQFELKLKSTHTTGPAQQPSDSAKKTLGSVGNAQVK